MEGLDGEEEGFSQVGDGGSRIDCRVVDAELGITGGSGKYSE